MIGKMSKVCAVAAVVSLAGSVGAVVAEPVTYQGTLTNNGQPNGVYDLNFGVFRSATGQDFVDGRVIRDVVVTDGVFSVMLPEEVAAAMASGGDLWLGLGVREAGALTGYTPLWPRQRVTASPRANVAGRLGSLTADDGVLSLSHSTNPAIADFTLTMGKPLDGITPGGSAVGTVLTGTPLVHTVFDIIANDPNDSFAVRTDSDFDGEVDLVAFNVDATGHLWQRGRGPYVADFETSDPSGRGFIRMGAPPFGKLWQFGVANDSGESRFDVQFLGNTQDFTPQVSIGAGDVRIDSEVFVKQAITINGADLAEQFDIVATASVEPIPGMVVSIDPAVPGGLAVSGVAYDRRVAGVISGAGGISPALHLRQPGTIADGDLPVAMSGRVYVYVDADAGGPVTAGDLLTTSATPGHAMRAGDRDAMHGAVIGKAMTDLDSGRGLVLVLVNLH